MKNGLPSPPLTGLVNEVPDPTARDAQSDLGLHCTLVESQDTIDYDD